MLAFICAASVFYSCTGGKITDTASTASRTFEKDTTRTEENPFAAAILGETRDYGNEYIDGFIFIGESTTYHLKNRGVLAGGKDTKQVWGPEGGTILLDASIKTLEIVYPDTGEKMTIAKATASKKPEYILLTFGLNGAVGNVKKGKEYYISVYSSLVEEIKNASPGTKIIIQSCFPIAENMDMSNYSITAAELNEHIRTLNGWALEMAYSLSLKYLDSFGALTGGDGMLRQEYQTGDGHHLTAEAYQVMLRYMKTHGYGG